MSINRAITRHALDALCPANVVGRHFCRRKREDRCPLNQHVSQNPFTDDCLLLDATLFTYKVNQKFVLHFASRSTTRIPKRHVEEQRICGWSGDHSDDARIALRAPCSTSFQQEHNRAKSNKRGRYSGYPCRPIGRHLLSGIDLLGKDADHESSPRPFGRGLGRVVATPLACARGSAQLTAPAVGSVSSLSSLMSTSVVSISPATLAALMSAVLATSAGSMIPVFTRSSYSPVAALKP